MHNARNLTSSHAVQYRWDEGKQVAINESQSHAIFSSRNGVATYRVHDDRLCDTYARRPFSNHRLIAMLFVQIRRTRLNENEHAVSSVRDFVSLARQIEMIRSLIKNSYLPVRVIKCFRQLVGQHYTQ